MHLMLLTLLVAAGKIGYGFRQAAKPIATARIGFQGSGAPLPMPPDGKLDPRFTIPLAWEVARVPVADRFDAPMGTQSGAFAYNAQKFWDMNVKRGGHHTGDDLNGIGGMDTDLGDPVHAVADGLVVYTGNPSPGWGNIVVLTHRTQDGRILQSMYAHLSKIRTRIGAVVARGERIADVGGADGMYPAHLHFEIRTGLAVSIGGGYTMQPFDHLDPMGTVHALRGAAEDDLAPSLLHTVLARDEAWTEMQIEGAEKFLDGRQK